jgi:tryptophan synthase beta subunit
MMQPYDLPDEFGHFGQFGGTFVAETLIEALVELKEQNFIVILNILLEDQALFISQSDLQSKQVELKFI